MPRAITRLGPRANEQFARYSRLSKWGEHIVISGPTGSGKTNLVPFVVQPRVNAGGHVIVFVMKPKPDETILTGFRGWTRWKKYRAPRTYDKRILLWPDTRGMNTRETLEHQREVFRHAFDEIFKTGSWCVILDEGLYTANPSFLNMSQEIAMLHSVGRSMGITMVTLTQRPAHLPLIVYSSASHAFVGRTSEQADLKRLSELGGRESSKAIATRLTDLGKHDFLWIPVSAGLPAEMLNLER